MPDGAQSGVIQDRRATSTVQLSSAVTRSAITLGQCSCCHLSRELSWAEQDLLLFSGSDGKFPTAGLVADGNGNLYGATSTAGSNGGGTNLELSPSSGGWTFQVLYNLTGTGFGGGPQPQSDGGRGGQSLGTTYGAEENRSGMFPCSSCRRAKAAGLIPRSTIFTGATDGGYP